MFQIYHVFSKFGEIWKVFKKFANIMFRKYYVFRPTTVEEFRELPPTTVEKSRTGSSDALELESAVS